MNATEIATTTQVYRVWIKATPEAIWDAITKPEWTDRYGYGGIAEFDLRPGAPYVVHPGAAMREFPNIPDEIIDGEILEADPPRRLSMTWRMLMDPGHGGRGLHEADLRDRGDRERRHPADGHPRARGRADAGRDGRRRGRGRGRRRRLGVGPLRPQVAARDGLAVSPTETPPAWRAARSGGSPACYSSSRPATRMPSSRARPSPMRRARPGTSAMIRKPSTSQPATISGKTVYGYSRLSARVFW